MNFRQVPRDVSFEAYRKNRDALTEPAAGTKTPAPRKQQEFTPRVACEDEEVPEEPKKLTQKPEEMPQPPHPHEPSLPAPDGTADYDHHELGSRSKSLCSGCYNIRAAASQTSAKSKQEEERRKSGALNIRRWNQEEAEAQKLTQEKKQRERRDFSDMNRELTMSRSALNLVVTPKVTATTPMTEDLRVKTAVLEETIRHIQLTHRKKDKELSKTQVGGGLNLPSYRKKPLGNREEYRRSLLDQIERDRAARIEMRKSNLGARPSQTSLLFGDHGKQQQQQQERFRRGEKANRVLSCSEETVRIERGDGKVDAGEDVGRVQAKRGEN